jgi:hypothetical protein
MSIFGDNVTNETVLEKLLDLKRWGETYNELNGDLYKNMCVTKMNYIIGELRKSDVYVNWVDPFRRHGYWKKIEFANLDKLIDKYSNGNIH